jgi:hypothetical protein
MQSVAQAWLVLELTKSPLQLGFVSALQFAPVLLLSPIGGVLSDRFPKRRVLLISQTAMQLQAFVLAALVWSGRIQYWHVAVLALIYGLGRAIDIPARQSYITDLVGRSSGSAVALNSMVMNRARIVGPAVAGCSLRGRRALPERGELRRGPGGAGGVRTSRPDQRPPRDQEGVLGQATPRRLHRSVRSVDGRGEPHGARHQRHRPLVAATS